MKFSDKQEEVINNRICDLLVSAAAGSGKTAVLVERIMRRLCREDNPASVDRLLIVTFTRNAAASLREKIDKAISEKMESEEISETLRRHLREQKRILPYASISTIDGFCGRVLKNYFYLTDVDPNYRIADKQECTMLLDEALKTTLEKEYDNAEGNEDSSFLRLVNRYGSVYGDESLSKAIKQIILCSSSTKYPEEYIKGLEDNYNISDDNAFNSSKLTKRYFELVRKTLKGLSGEFRRMANDFEKYCALFNDFYKVCDCLEQDAQDMLRLSQLSIPSELNGELDVFKFGRFPTFKNLNDDLEAVKNKMKDLRAAVTKIYKEDIKATAGFSRIEFYEENKNCLLYVRELIRITLLVKEEYERLKKNRNIMEFSDVSHKVLSLLINKSEVKHSQLETTQDNSDQDGTLDTQQNIAVIHGTGNGIGERLTDCARELCASYDEIMIDEYQDSNDVQEAILTAVSGETEGKKKLFMVGDVKQSIYGFRMAKPALFTDKYDRYKDYGDEKKIDLSQNFRSTLGVIDAVNAVFGRIMKKDYCRIEYDDAASLKTGELYKEHPEIENEPSEMIIVRADDKKSDGRKKISILTLASEIKRLMSSDYKVLEDGKERNLRYGDICVLTRKMSGLGTVLSETLKDQGIPADVKTGEGYFQTREITLILSFLRIIDNPYQDIEFASVLRSFIGGLDDEELAMMKVYDNKNGRKHSYLYDIMNEIVKDESIAGNLKSKLQIFKSKYEELREESAHVSLRNLISDVYRKTAYYEFARCLPAGRQRTANLDLLLYKAADFEKTDMKTISLFLSYIEKLVKNNMDEGEADMSDSTDAVNVMTIHASKGLEFPVVFIIGMETAFSNKLTKNGGKKDRIPVHVHAHHEYGLAIKRFDETTNLLKKTIQEGMIKKLALNDQDAEEMRLFYVAMTRARQKLLMISVNSDLYDEKKQTRNEWIRLGKQKPGYFELENLSSYSDMAAPVFLNASETDRFLCRELSCDDFQGEIAETEDSYCFPDSEEIKRIREYIDAPYRYVRCSIPVKYSVSDLKHMAVEEYEEEMKNNKLCATGEEFEQDKGENGSGDENRESVSADDKTLIAECEAHKTTVAHTAESSQKSSDVSAISDEKPSTKEENQKFAEISTQQGNFGTERIKTEGWDEENLGIKRGNLTHNLLRLAVPTGIKNMKELKAFASSMVDKGRMDPETLKLVGFKKTAAFLKTDLCRRMREAEDRNELFLEQPFVYGIPASELVEDYDGDERTLLQGIIDAFFIEDGGVILVDYKTDHVEKGEAGEAMLKKRYKAQLDYYSKALASILGIPVKEKLVYSICLGKSIDFS